MSPTALRAYNLRNQRARAAYRSEVACRRCGTLAGPSPNRVQVVCDLCRKEES